MGFVADGLTSFVERPWRRTSETSAPIADAIVVLSGGGIFNRGRDEVIEWSDPDRFFAGVKLFKAGKAPKLLFTGETLRNKTVTSGQLYMKEAINFGIPMRAMSTTSNVRNTSDEAKKIREILIQSSNKKNPSILLVTSAFHMSRAKLIFERQGLHVKPFAVDFNSTSQAIFRGIYFQNPGDWLPTSGGLHRSSLALREILGRIIYRVW